MRRRLITEVVLILAVTFGTSGVRAVLRLVDSLLTAPLNEQSTTLIDAASTTTWLDLALQATSALTLIGGAGWRGTCCACRGVGRRGKTSRAGPGSPHSLGCPGWRSTSPGCIWG